MLKEIIIFPFQLEYNKGRKRRDMKDHGKFIMSISYLKC